MQPGTLTRRRIGDKEAAGRNRRQWLTGSVRLRVAGCAAVLMAAACTDSGPGAAGGDGTQVHPGRAVYERFCFSCHAAGVAGAPVTGDPVSWEPRLARGKDQLLRSTLQGMPPGMPERGLCFDCSEEDLAAAIDYMLLQGR